MFQKALNFQNTNYFLHKKEIGEKKMKSRNLYLAMAIGFILVLMTFVPIANAQVRTASLRINFYSSDTVCFAALLAGDIDVMIWPLTITQYTTAIADPNLVLGPVLENGMREFDLNCNETIAYYPGINSPTSYWSFRAALACLSNKQYYAQGILGGFAARMDVPVVANAPTWLNTSVIYPNYPWEYDPELAADLLDDDGFVQGQTPNPEYDDGYAWSAQYIRVYPDTAPVHDNPHVGTDVKNPPYVWHLMQDAVGVVEVKGVPIGKHYYENVPYIFDSGADTITVNIELTNCTYLWIEYLIAHPKAGQDLDPIRFFARSDDPLARLPAGVDLNAHMLKSGIPVQFNALPSAGCRPQVMTARNYHIYTGGWSLGRFPTSLFPLYGPLFWYPDGANYVAPPCPRPTPSGSPSIIDPNYSMYLEEIYYAVDIPAAIVAAKKAQGIHVLKAVNIPLWTSKSFYAWRSWTLGIVNMAAYGPENGYTFMNTYKASGAPEQNVLRFGMNQPPQSHNILYAQWTYDYALLDRYWEGGQAVNPYDIGRDQAWIVQDWTPGTWVDPDDGETKTSCTFWIRKDVSWADPITGAYRRGFTAHDVEFGNLFYFFFDDGWNWDNTMDVDHIEIVDDYTYKICFSAESYWFQYSANYPYLPKEEWGAEFCTPAVYSEPGASYAAGESLFLMGGLEPNRTGDGVAQVQSITVGGSPFTDYWIRFNSTGAYSANRIYFKSAVSGDLVINYWNITGDTKGYYPGSDTVWVDTSYSLGEYIPVEFTTDWALFDRNNYFFLDTPPLGEIDWYWWWEARDTSRPLGGPRKGTFIVDIYDVTFATVSYGSTGYLEPTTSPPWFPGADLAPSYVMPYPYYGGEIDIYDVSTILVNYGTEFGRPPS
jgi:hypothetical protein